MSKMKSLVEKSAAALLYLSVLFLILIGVEKVSKANQIFLVLAALFIAATFLWLVLERKLWATVKQGVGYALFFAVLLIISTVKYGISLVNQQGITFFTVYQMVIYAAFGCMTFAYLSHHKQALPVIMLIVSVTVSAVVLLGHNRYMLDLGVFRFLAEYTSPNIVGIFTVIAFFASLYLLVSHQPLKMLHLVNMGVSASATILTGSRSAVIALAVGLTCWGLFSIPFVRLRKWKQLSINFVVPALLTAAFFMMLRPVDTDKLELKVITDWESIQIQQEQIQPDIGETTEPTQTATTEFEGNKPDADKNTSTVKNDSWERFLQRFSLAENGTSSLTNNLRLQIWLKYLKNLPEYALFGTDYKLTGRPIMHGFARDTHNTLVYTLFRFGVFGLLSLVLLLLIVGFRLLLRKRKTQEQIVCLAMFGAVIVISMLIDMLNTAAYHLVVAIAYAAVVDVERLSRKEESPEKILQVFSSINRGGAETRTIDFMHTIDRSKVLLDFAVTSPNPEQQYYYEEIINAGGKVFGIRSWKEIGIAGYFAQWSKILCDGEYRVIHSHAGALAAIPMYVAWINNVPVRISHAHNSSADKSGAAVLRVYQMITNLFANTWLYCSKEAAVFNFGKKILSRNHAHFLPNGVDISKYPQLSAEQKNRIKEEFAIPFDSLVIGTVGNARPVKNHLFLVKIFHKLLEAEPQAILVIAGKNEQDVDAKQYVKENNLEDKVRFLGAVSNIPELLQILDLFVLPSFHEGAPVSAVEAQISNVPCILSDSITRDVDIGAGLIQYLPLDAPMEVWVQQMLKNCRMDRPAPDATVEKACSARYDATGAAESLLEIYNRK